MATTVSTDAEAEEFGQFLDDERVAAEDRATRRIGALRGAASDGIAVTRGRSGAGSHHYRRGRVLASGRSGRCRSAGYDVTFSSLRSLRVCLTEPEREGEHSMEAGKDI